MDISSILGLILGTVFMVWGIFKSGDLGAYWDVSSIIITLGGTVASTITSFPMRDIRSTLKVAKKAFVHTEISLDKVIKDIISLANVARKEGLLSLEEYADNLDDDFLSKGVMLIVDGTEPELVRNILETELLYLEERHANGQNYLKRQLLLLQLLE